MGLLQAIGTKERAPTWMAVFWQGKIVLKTMVFRDAAVAATVLIDRKHLKMVIRSVPDSVSLISGTHCFTQHSSIPIDDT